MCQATPESVKAEALWEETGKCTEGALRGMGPSNHTKLEVESNL